MLPRRKYQNDMVNFALWNHYVKNTGAGFFCDPGLGKTRATLDEIQELIQLGEVNRALVVAPKRVATMTWPREIEKWGFDGPHQVLCGKRGNSMAKALRRESRIDIINPESVKHMVDHAGLWDMVVADESTKFKNFTAARTRAMRKLAPKTPHRLILTGTPTAHSILDLFAQIYMLDLGQSLGKTLSVFRHRFARKGGFDQRQWELRPGADKEITEAIKHLVIRLDAESNLDMPELIFKDVKVKFPAKLQKDYNQLKRDLLLQLEQRNILLQNAAGAYTKMRQMANGSVLDEHGNIHHIHSEKIDAVLDTHEELGWKPVLLGYTYRGDAEKIARAYAKLKKPIAFINGNTKSKDEPEIERRWNNGDLCLLACQYISTSYGLNLQGPCHHVMQFCETDSAGDNTQFIRRVYRQGVSGQHVMVYRFITENTVDQVVRKRLDGKNTSQEAFFQMLKEHARQA